MISLQLEHIFNYAVFTKNNKSIIGSLYHYRKKLARVMAAKLGLVNPQLGNVGYLGWQPSPEITKNGYHGSLVKDETY